MRDRALEEHLRQALGRQTAPLRMEQTVGLCVQIVRRQNAPAEMRTGFWGFLSGVFRFEGAPILLSQAGALALACLAACASSGDLRRIPAYAPLFVLAAVPSFCRGRYHRVSELEAATRSSGAQLALARLLLAGAADLVCMTVLLGLEIRLTDGLRALGPMILYCLVPYLVCMTALLHLVRSGRSGSMAPAAVTAIGSCLFWRASSRVTPGLYELSALGVWIAAFAVFSAFFAREICFIIQANREGKMYGTVV